MKAIAQTVLFIYLLGSCLAQLQLSKVRRTVATRASGLVLYNST